MSDSLDDVRAELAVQRVSLLRRESRNLRNARRILAEIEARPEAEERILRQARRAVDLTDRAHRLGIVDARRVGASIADIADAAGLDEDAVTRVLDAR
jgi:hypothetical protein